MKPTKKRPAKRTTAKRAVKRGSVEHKLLQVPKYKLIVTEYNNV